MAEPVPLFAFVGPVNPGKTSVIATLIEDDELRISPTPGETTETQYFDVFVGGKCVLRFCDTPGFQNPKETLAILRELTGENTDPLAAFRIFVQKFGTDPNYTEECKIFRPILEGAGIVYVVDASRKVLSANEAEMEILRMTGRPRLGLINWTNGPVHLQDWKNRLGVHFNVKLEFNAHTATFSERIHIIESLSLIEQSWRPAIHEAAETLRQEWSERIHEVAEVIEDLLTSALQHQESSNFTSEKTRETEQNKAVENYKQAIRQLETKAHRQIISLFRHHRVEVSQSVSTLLQFDLFSEKAWQVFGLNRAQLLLAGAATGAGTGALVEGLLLGHGLGVPTLLFTTIGAVGAGASAFFGGEHLARVKLPLSHKVRRMLGWDGGLGGTQIRVGPNQHPQFPWLLLDRAVSVFYIASRRPHAIQEKVALDADALINQLVTEKVLSKTWELEDRKICERIFTQIRKGKANSDDLEKLITQIESRLTSITS